MQWFVSLLSLCCNGPNVPLPSISSTLLCWKLYEVLSLVESQVKSLWQYLSAPVAFRNLEPTFFSSQGQSPNDISNMPRTSPFDDIVLPRLSRIVSTKSSHLALTNCPIRWILRHLLWLPVVEYFPNQMCCHTVITVSSPNAPDAHSLKVNMRLFSIQCYKNNRQANNEWNSKTKK